MEAASSAPARPSAMDWTFRVLGFLALMAACFALPIYPASDLDTSWRMAFGRFFVEGRQFGKDIVFTYGPLGWTMGRAYWGQQWAAQIGWQLGQSFLLAALVTWHAFRLTGYRRVFFLLFYLLFGLTYQDAIQQLAMIFAGLELIRRAGSPWRWSSLFLLVVLAVYSLVKFNNLLLGAFVAGIAGVVELWVARKAWALRLPALFTALFLAGWMLCRQRLGTLPAYVHSSWEISTGYQDAMFLSCPPVQLALGVATAALLVIYLAVNSLTQPDRVRAAALGLAAAAYLYLNWKHGFIRADGHQIGFYYAALTIVTGAPLLLADGSRWRAVKNLLLTAAGIASVVAIELVLPGLARGALSMFERALNRTAAYVAHPEDTHADYDNRLSQQKDATRLNHTKGEVKGASLDVLGFEQGVALFNDFNYQPRPVFQSYSAYTPYLTNLNGKYYASDRAPEYALFKMQVIDGRLAVMDDQEVLRLLVQRYTYVFSDQAFTLWKRKPGPFHAADYAPKPLRTIPAKLGEKIDVTDLAGQNLWVQIDYQPTLLGRLRRFLFKPALVELHVTDQAGVESSYRLPQPIAASGFMLNPIVNDMMEFMRAAGGEPTRRLASVRVDTAPEDRKYVSDALAFKFSALPPSDAGKDYFRTADKSKFFMFVDAPVSYEALNPPNPDMIDNVQVMVMHAPSRMVFDVPAGAKEITGSYGFVAGAYRNGGKTNGAEFVISWTDGNEPVILQERYLDPVAKAGDRGLQKFALTLPKGTGRVTLEVKPGLYGEYAFDWTGWTGIEFK